MRATQHMIVFLALRAKKWLLHHVLTCNKSHEWAEQQDRSTINMATWQLRIKLLCLSTWLNLPGHRELWHPPATNSLSVTCQILWPEAAIVHCGQIPQHFNCYVRGTIWSYFSWSRGKQVHGCQNFWPLWPIKCCGIWPQRTVAVNNLCVISKVLWSSATPNCGDQRP